LQINNKVQSAYNITADKSVPLVQDGESVKIALECVDGFAMTVLKY
jgi:hypothetical protein